MKLTFRLYRRGRRYYCQNNDTGQQKSLETSDKPMAPRPLHGKNEAAILVGWINVSMDNRYAGHVALLDKDDIGQSWPPTNMVVVAEKS